MDKTYTVPKGTEIYEILEEGEELKKLADLDEEGQKFCVGKGG